MKILGIETSGQQFSLCLSENEKLLLEIRKERTLCPNTRDGHLFTEVKSLLSYLGSEGPGAIAISIGPGMFTSLRVGLSLAKGLNLSRNIPLYAINTLDSIGMAVPCLEAVAKNPDGCGDRDAFAVVPVICAHRNELYAAIYLDGRRVGEYLLCLPAELGATVRESCSSSARKPLIAFVGPGVGLMKGIVNEQTPGNGFCILDSDAFMPSAFKVIKLALERIRTGDADDPAKLEPFYLKKTDAERHFQS